MAESPDRGEENGESEVTPSPSDTAERTVTTVNDNNGRTHSNGKHSATAVHTAESKDAADNGDDDHDQDQDQDHDHQSSTSPGVADAADQDDKQPDDMQRAGSHEPSMFETDVKEQDRWLPIANVARIMKTALPDNAKIAKEAKECMQECVSEFISFITSEASEKCQHEKRKTVNGEDILFAMNSLGFENYGEALKIYLARYRETTVSKSEHQANALAAAAQQNRPGSGYNAATANNNGTSTGISSNTAGLLGESSIEGSGGVGDTTAKDGIGLGLGGQQTVAGSLEAAGLSRPVGAGGVVPPGLMGTGGMPAVTNGGGGGQFGSIGGSSGGGYGGQGFS